jgi:CheY-like chemotaxis protein
VQSIETLFNPKALEKKVNFELNPSPRIPQTLIGDPTRVSQIVVNLLSNAFKFTERGYVALSTELFDDNTDFATVKITVKDTGIGISDQDLPRVFERFQQAQDDTTRLYGGSGLGLAIVKNLAEAMGGFVEADSKLGFGSTFSVILPLRKVAETLPSDVAKKPNTPPQYLGVSKQNTAAKTASEGRQFKILVVEDNPMNQRLAALLLSDWGYDFEMVEDGQQAVEILQRVDFQLILMDIQLPNMDGYAATSVIRHQLKNLIPIIAMTAHAFAGEREKCLAAGMDDYVPKPLQEDKVLAVIQKHINKNSVSIG